MKASELRGGDVFVSGDDPQEYTALDRGNVTGTILNRHEFRAEMAEDGNLCFLRPADVLAVKHGAWHLVGVSGDADVTVVRGRKDDE